VSGRRDDRGAALIAVLLALTLLLSLGVPFLFASRLRSDAAARVYDRSLAQVAAASVSEAAAWHQGMSHPGVDPTPLWDSPDEWDLSPLGPLPQALGGPWEQVSESWGVEVESLQARVSLASAPPMLVQSLLHPCFLTRDATYRDSEIRVNSTEGFPDSGMLVLGSTYVQYGAKTTRSFTEVVPDPNPPEDLEERRFRAGRSIVDPRVFEALLGRFGADGWRVPGTPGAVIDFGTGGAAVLPDYERRMLAQLSWPSTGDFGSADWQPASFQTRIIDPAFPNLLFVGDGSWFNAGSVIRVLPEEGPPIDSLVLATGGDRLLLAQPLPDDLEPIHTRVYCLRREPVDINACRFEVLEALVLGLSFRGAPPVASDRSVSGRPGLEWVTPEDARRFSEAVMQARPLQGPEDLWQRVLAPLAASDAITDIDAWAILMNSLDPTSGVLLQSTTGFEYRSGDRYLTRVNAAVRSRLGRTLARAAWREDVRVAPDGELLDLLQDQQAFTAATRHGRGLHGAMSTPNNLGQSLAAFATPPTALTLRTGARSETGRVVPDIEPELSAVMPLPARAGDQFPQGTIGSVEHFDFEPSPLGRRIDETGPLRRQVPAWGIPHDNGLSDVEPLYVEGWFRFEGGLTDGALFNVAGIELRRNRVLASIEGGVLTVRCWDTAGEDPSDPDGFEEAVRVRVDPVDYRLADRWVHVGVLLRGASPRGMQVFLDGVPHGEIDGHTWLTTALGGYAPGDVGGEVRVESTEGFPARGAIRIGDEVIEYSAKTANSFILDRAPGDGGYFGGRAVREVTDPLALTLDSDHPQGAGVELYGYSAILAADVPPGGGTMSGDVGPWSMGIAINAPEEIEIQTQLGFTFPVGRGISGTYTGAVELAPMPQVPGDELYAEAFQSNGGLALMWAGRLAATNAQDGSRIGGIEVVRYSARNGTTVTISERNLETPGLAEAPDGVFDPAGTTFVTEWNPEILLAGSGEPLAELERYKVYLMPISVKGGGVSDLAYAVGDERQSQWVQITDPADDAKTEWVRYDNIVDGHFVRDDWGALSRAFNDLFNPEDEEDPIENPQEPGGPGGPGGPPIAIRAPVAPAAVRPRIDPAPTAPDRAVVEPFQQQQEPEEQYEFRPTIGEPAERDEFLERISQELDFRGSMGTFDHEQTAGALLVPVFQTVRGAGANRGLPGRFDRVAMMQPDASSQPFWFTIQWADARPGFERVRPDVWYVAFDAHPGLPFPASDFQQLIEQGDNLDLRNFARISKFPNQERPRSLDSVTVGGDVADVLPPLQGFVDEFSVRAVGGMGGTSQSWSRGAFYLSDDLDALASGIIEVNQFDLLVDGYRPSVQGNAGAYLNRIPESGILDIDGERIAYSGVDASSGELTIAPGGRGLHGTEPRGHSRGAKVWLVDGRATTALTSALGAGDWQLQVEDARGFGTSDLLLIEDELLHAPSRTVGAGNLLMMPRERPRGDESTTGRGILRGRFGTTPSGHPEGAVVYSFPTRWMHTWAERDDSGVVARAQFGWEEPDAWWGALLWEEEHPEGSGRLRIIARAGQASWEDDPERTPGLRSSDELDATARRLPLEFRADRLEVRVHFDWTEGAFDPVAFDDFGWTSAPRLRRLVLDYLAGTRVLRREEIVE
jgi:hypothetical protein